MSTVTMQELELETAELLPSRETLCYYKPPCCHPYCPPPPCCGVELSLCVSIRL